MLVSPEKLAGRWELTTPTVRDLLRRGAIPGIKVGRFWRIRIEVVEAAEKLGVPTSPAPRRERQQ
jgi:excisionase family DNA binding protein